MTNERGRPSAYSLDAARSINQRVANGETLQAICASSASPDRATVYRWLAAHREFRDMYARAREDRADLIADEILEIADTATDANLARVQIDARKWAAAKLYPKRYSDKLIHQGSADRPIKTAGEIRIVIVDPAEDVAERRMPPLPPLPAGRVL